MLNWKKEGIHIKTRGIIEDLLEVRVPYIDEKDFSGNK